MEEPSAYRVSTITFNGDLNVSLRGPVFFQHASVREAMGIVWMECWAEGRQCLRGVFPKKKSSSKRVSKEKEAENPRNKSFDNQISMYYCFKADYIPHVKLFKNGNVHMTGLRTTDDGMAILDYLKSEIARIYEIEPDLAVDRDISKMSITKPTIRLINSDFHVPFKIRRKELHQLLIEPPYHTICSFQPGTYPGVKLEYYWNVANDKKDGRCRCETTCYGKKHGACKKVTVAVFDSGSVLITGATAHVQVEDAYRFICQVIMDHKDLLKKNIPTLSAE